MDERNCGGIIAHPQAIHKPEEAFADQTPYLSESKQPLLKIRAQNVKILETAGSSSNPS
jgi:hypothetical protein